MLWGRSQDQIRPHNAHVDDRSVFHQQLVKTVTYIANPRLVTAIFAASATYPDTQRPDS